MKMCQNNKRLAVQ